MDDCLWTNCFYFLYQTQKAQLKSVSSHCLGTFNTLLQTKQVEIVSVIINDLEFATSFYQSFIIALNAKFDHRKTDKNIRNASRKLVFKALICLGDLARYKEMYSSDEKSFRDAFEWYRKASRFNPRGGTLPFALKPCCLGKPFSQLALLSSYCGNIVDVVYYNCLGYFIIIMSSSDMGQFWKCRARSCCICKSATVSQSSKGTRKVERFFYFILGIITRLYESKNTQFDGIGPIRLQNTLDLQTYHFSSCFTL